MWYSSRKKQRFKGLHQWVWAATGAGKVIKYDQGRPWAWFLRPFCTPIHCSVVYNGKLLRWQSLFPPWLKQHNEGHLCSVNAVHSEHFYVSFWLDNPYVLFERPFCLHILSLKSNRLIKINELSTTILDNLVGGLVCKLNFHAKGQSSSPSIDLLLIFTFLLTLIMIEEMGLGRGCTFGFDGLVNPVYAHSMLIA